MAAVVVSVLGLAPGIGRAQQAANVTDPAGAPDTPAPRPITPPSEVPGLSTGALLGEAPGLFSNAPTQVYVTCVAVTPDMVLRSDLIPQGSTPVADIERSWRRFLTTDGASAAEPHCAAPRHAGKTAAYVDLDARVRRVRDRTGVRSVRYTGWRD